jgi:penicillin-binding protein 1A
MQVNYNRITSSEGPAPYFREHIRQKVSNILKSETAPDGKQYNLYTDGLIIQTTVDSRVQAAAEKAVAAQMKELQEILNQQIARNPIFENEQDSTIQYAWRQSDQYQQLKNAGRTDAELDSILYTPVEMDLFTWDGYEQRSATPYDSLKHYLSFLNSGFLAMNPQNGNVLAWVGGINHKHFKYDHVKSKRQVGSAFKPIVYAAALESGMRPCDYRRNILTTYEEYEEWTPRNHADEYGGRYSISAALAHSYNTIAVDLLMETGIPEVQNTAKKMGIQSYIPPEPSIALGTAEVSLMELVTSYTTFLNEGKPAFPVLITSIKNAQGEIIYQPESETPGYNEQVASALKHENSLSPRTASTMVRMLEKVVNEGTGYRLRSRFGIQHALAGKTGTTQDYSDGWFVGMTPEMVFGSWVGGWNNRIRLKGNMGYGSQTALPISGRFLQNLQSYPDFEQPNQFYANQTDQAYRLSCPDFRPDKLSDRLRDFFKGRDDDEAVVEDGEERESIFGRIRNLFTNDDEDNDKEKNEEGEKEDQ